MFSPMEPLIEDSVTCVGPDRWLLGSLYTCEVVHTVTDNTITSWEDHGKIYHIRESSKNERSSISNDSAAGRIHHAGTSAAVWNIGGTFIKAKAWRRNMQLESDTIEFVKRISSLPIPGVIFSWVDVDWNRTFLISKALKGHTLDHVWGSLSTNQRMHVADKIAEYCKELASTTSQNLMTEGGSGLQETFLIPRQPDTEPSWRPQNFGPYSSSQLRSFLPKSLADHTGLFHFYHADLGPSNIIVSKNGSIAGIIDWESAAYYPKFWLGTKPLVSAGFSLHIEHERWAWATLLGKSLAREGFLPDMETYEIWKKAVREHEL
jgi:hypothetical protein